jgi:hypothetical protein
MLSVERHFVGKDASGQPVVVPVRVNLDRSFGRASRQPPKTEPPLPPATSLEPQDLKTLVGRWEGYYRIPEYRIPIEAVIHEDGSVDVGENDPVTNRYRVTLSVRNGRVWSYTRNAIELTYHQGGGRSVLAGQITAVTGGSGAARFPLWLERTGSLP